MAYVLSMGYILAIALDIWVYYPHNASHSLKFGYRSDDRNTNERLDATTYSL